MPVYIKSIFGTDEKFMLVENPVSFIPSGFSGMRFVMSPDLVDTATIKSWVIVSQHMSSLDAALTLSYMSEIDRERIFSSDTCDLHTFRVRFGTFDSPAFDCKKFAIVENNEDTEDIIKSLNFCEFIVFARNGKHSIPCWTETVDDSCHPTITFESDLSNEDLYAKIKSMSLHEVSKISIRMPKTPVKIGDTMPSKLSVQEQINAIVQKQIDDLANEVATKLLEHAKTYTVFDTRQKLITLHSNKSVKALRTALAKYLDPERISADELSLWYTF